MRSTNRHTSRFTGVVTATAIAAVTLLVLDGHSTRLGAQSDSSAEIPKLSAIWHRKGPLNGVPNEPAVPTNRAAGFSQAFDEALNPAYDCYPTPVPGLLGDEYDMQISQQADRVVLRYEKIDVVRTIWLEGHGHPKPAGSEYANQGFSFGRYERGRLIVETTKFAFDPRGFQGDRWIPGSTTKKMTETYWREGDTLKLDSVSEDPLTLKQPYRYGWEWTVREEPLLPYDCSPSSPDRFPEE